MLLLSAATLAITTSTRASAMLADDATLVARAQAIGSESLELARILSACAAPVPAVRAVPRVTATLLPTVGAGVVVSLFSATLTLSPFAGRTDPLLSLGTARRCE